jgi:hypothetical protein
MKDPLGSHYGKFEICEDCEKFNDGQRLSFTIDGRNDGRTSAPNTKSPILFEIGDNNYPNDSKNMTANKLNL